MESLIADALLFHGVTCSFSIEIGFDEVVLERGMGYMELIGVRLSSVAPDNIHDLSAKLGRLLSPYPGVIFTASTSHLTALTGANGETLDVDETVERRTISHRDASTERLGLKDESQLRMNQEAVDQGDGSGSSGNKDLSPERETNASRHHPDGGHEQGDKRGNGKGRDFSGRDNRKDENGEPGEFDANGDHAPAESAPGTPSISFEAVACIYRGKKEEIELKESLFQTLILSGTITCDKQESIVSPSSSSSSRALPRPKSKVEFDELRFQSDAQSLSARYRQVAARVEIDSMHKLAITKASPLSTPASDGKVKQISAQKFSLSAALNAGANWITSPVSGSIGSTVQASSSRETTRFGSRIVHKRSAGKATWGFEIDDDYQQLNGFEILNKENLPCANFTYFEGSPSFTTIRVESTWKLDRASHTAQSRGILLANLSHFFQLRTPTDLPADTKVLCNTKMVKSSNNLAETEKYISDARVEHMSWVYDGDDKLPALAPSNNRDSSTAARIKCPPVAIVIPDPLPESPQQSLTSTENETQASIPVPENNTVELQVVAATA